MTSKKTVTQNESLILLKEKVSTQSQNETMQDLQHISLCENWSPEEYATAYLFLYEIKSFISVENKPEAFICELEKHKYATNNLWSVNDILIPIADGAKLEILNGVLDSDFISGEIRNAIDVAVSDYIEKVGVYLNIRFLDSGEKQVLRFTIEGSKINDDLIFFHFEDIQEMKEFISGETPRKYDFEFVSPENA